MLIRKLTTDDQNQYSNFVATNSGGSFLQSWGWGEFQIQLNRSVVRYGIFEKEQMVATVQFIKTPVPHLNGFYLYSPYGPVVSETLNKNTNSKKLINELTQQVILDYPDCWFVRYEPKQDLQIEGAATPRIQPGKTLVTNLTDSLETILVGMHQKNRYNIKVAEKHNVVVESEISVSPQHGFHITELLDLLTQTSDRQKFRSYDQNYYQKLIDFFVLHSRENDCKVSLYKALYNKHLVAGAVMIDHGTTRTYLFGGSDNSQRNLMAPYALHWQAIQDAKTAGLTSYDWWGIETASGETPGFVQFKLKWGGQQISYPSPVDIVNKGTWYLIYKLLRKINRLF